MPLASTSRPEILGIPFDRVSTNEVLILVADAVRKKTFFHIVTPGPEFLMLAKQHSEFRDCLRHANLSLPDGMGIVLAARMLGFPALRRVTGTDVLYGILREAQQQGWKIFFYGVLREGTIGTAAEQAVQKYPRLQLVGAESGFRRWLRLPDAVVCWRIRRSQADILFVALGAPAQELWIVRNRHRLGTVRVAVGVGGALDYLAGSVIRAPRPIRALGFEWLWRLFIQPRRRWRRIQTAIWEFPLAVLREHRRV